MSVLRASVCCGRTVRARCRASGSGPGAVPCTTPTPVTTQGRCHAVWPRRREHADPAPRVRVAAPPSLLPLPAVPPRAPRSGPARHHKQKPVRKDCPILQSACARPAPIDNPPNPKTVTVSGRWSLAQRRLRASGCRTATVRPPIVRPGFAAHLFMPQPTLAWARVSCWGGSVPWLLRVGVGIGAHFRLY